MTARLRPKYMVMKIDANGETFCPGMNSTDPDDINSPFVLMPRKDPAAMAAMLTYMRVCEPLLASEIRQWLLRIAKSDPALGTQGRRNESAAWLRLIQEEE